MAGWEIPKNYPTYNPNWSSKVMLSLIVPPQPTTISLRSSPTVRSSMKDGRVMVSNQEDNDSHTKSMLGCNNYDNRFKRMNIMIILRMMILRWTYWMLEEHNHHHYQTIVIKILIPIFNMIYHYHSLVTHWVDCTHDMPYGIYNFKATLAHRVEWQHMVVTSKYHCRCYIRPYLLRLVLLI